MLGSIPNAVVAFLVIFPTPCLKSPQKEALTETFVRLTSRSSPLDSAHKAEAISLVLWDPHTGEIDHAHPASNSILRIEAFSRQVENAYVDRYRGLPPHT